MITNIEDQIRAKTEAFAAALGELVRRAALEATVAALNGGALGAEPVQATRGRRRSWRARAPARAAAPAVRALRGQAAARGAKATLATRAAGSRKAAPRRALGEKRPPAELAKLTEKLGDYIKAHPGERMEAIGKALGVPTRELNLPVKKLLAARRIRTQGHKRATEYFAA
jgi:hypothetical protein